MEEASSGRCREAVSNRLGPRRSGRPLDRRRRGGHPTRALLRREGGVLDGKLAATCSSAMAGRSQLSEGSSLSPVARQSYRLRGGFRGGVSPFRSENSLGSQAHGGLLLGGVHPPRAGFGSVRDCGISDLGLPWIIEEQLFSQFSFVRNSLPFAGPWVECVVWVVCGVWVFVSLGKRDAGLLAGHGFPKSGSLPVGSGSVFQFVF